MNPKRLLILVGSYYPEHVGGTENYVRNLVNDIKSIGWQAYIMAPSLDNKERSYDYEGVPVYRYPRSINPSKEEIRGDVKPEYLR